MGSGRCRSPADVMASGHPARQASPLRKHRIQTDLPMFDFLKRRRRARIAEQPFPAEWEEVLRKNVPAFAALSGDEREELRDLVQVFVAEKSFEGCGGVEVTDEMRVTIAAQACLLILHVDDDVYPRLRSILIYPKGYRAPVEARDGD